jgi:hypothetical protein
MMTLADALDHLGYDEVDDKIRRVVGGELEESKAYLCGAVGADILELMPDDPRLDILLKAYLDDRHDDRGVTSAKAAAAKREMVHSTEWQLRLELARIREEAAV